MILSMPCLLYPYLCLPQMLRAPTGLSNPVRCAPQRHPVSALCIWQYI